MLLPKYHRDSESLFPELYSNRSLPDVIGIEPQLGGVVLGSRLVVVAHLERKTENVCRVETKKQMTL